METATSAPSPGTSAAEQAVLAATPRLGAATTPLPANSPTPEATTTPTPEPPTPVPDTCVGDPDHQGPRQRQHHQRRPPHLRHPGPPRPGRRRNPRRRRPRNSRQRPPANPDRMPGEFPVEPPVWGNDSDQVQVGSPGLRKDLFGVPLVFSPDVRSQFGSATETAPRCGSIQRVEIALPHPDGRHGPIHGASESKYGRVARGQLAVVFNLEVQDRQVLLPSPSLSRWPSSARAQPTAPHEPARNGSTFIEQPIQYIVHGFQNRS